MSSPRRREHPIKIVEEIKKALYAKYLTSTLWTTDKIPFYLNHAPQSVVYPIIVVNYISSNNTMAMPTVAKPSGWDYIDGRFQFAVRGNDRQLSTLTDIQDRLEDLFHRTSLTLGNDCTHLGTISLNQGTEFFEDALKVWTITNDYRILAGK